MGGLSVVAIFLLILLLTSAALPCLAVSTTKETFSKKTGSAAASMFLFLLPKMAKESAKAVGKAGMESSASTVTAFSALQYKRSMLNESEVEAVTAVGSILKECKGKPAMECLVAKTKQAMSFLYKEREQETGSSCPPSCFRPNPVCGKDGITYWCGVVDAECAGVEVEHVGFCDFDSKETGGKGVLAAQSLLLVHMIWLMLAACLVLLGFP